jgi:Uma2 family endonuclease
MTPTGSETSSRNSRLVMRLPLRADGQGGWKVFDSWGGFPLPDGAVLSPDASLVRLDRWRSLSAEQRCGFAPLCPDLVAELASTSGAPQDGLSTRPTAPTWVGCCSTAGAGGGDLAGCRRQ